MLAKVYLCAVVTAGPADQDSRSSPGSRRELWPTATAVNRVRGEETLAKCAAFRKRNANQNTVPLYLEEKVRIEEAKQWPTPSAMEAEKAGNYAQGQMGNSLSAMAKRGELMAWATPECKNHVGYQVGADGTKYLRLGSQVGQWATPNVPNGGRTTTGSPEKQTKVQVMLHHQTGGKLNPRWVETLMGLPVGWTMPSCASPVTPEWTSSDCSETASSQQQPSEPLTS